MKENNDDKCGVATIVLHDINEIITIEYASYHHMDGAIIIHKSKGQLEKDGRKR